MRTRFILVSDVTWLTPYHCCFALRDSRSIVGSSRWPLACGRFQVRSLLLAFLAVKSSHNCIVAGTQSALWLVAQLALIRHCRSSSVRSHPGCPPADRRPAVFLRPCRFISLIIFRQSRVSVSAVSWTHSRFRAASLRSSAMTSRGDMATREFARNHERMVCFEITH